MNLPTHQSDPLNRARLRWRARRGLLENDVILTRFLDAHESELSDDEVGALSALLDLSDNELLDLLLSRKEPDDSLQTQSVLQVLNRLRTV